MRFWEVVLYCSLVLSVVQNARLAVAKTYLEATIDQQQEIIKSQGLRIQKLDELNRFITKPPC